MSKVLLNEQPHLNVAVQITADCTYCGLHRANIHIGEGATGALEPVQIGTICPHLELVLVGYKQKAAIARGLTTR